MGNAVPAVRSHTRATCPYEISGNAPLEADVSKSHLIIGKKKHS